MSLKTVFNWLTIIPSRRADKLAFLSYIVDGGKISHIIRLKRTNIIFFFKIKLHRIYNFSEIFIMESGVAKALTSFEDESTNSQI